MPEPSFLLASTCTTHTHRHTRRQLTIVKPHNPPGVCWRKAISLLTISYLDVRERTVDPDGSKRIHGVCCRQRLLRAFDSVCLIAYSAAPLFRGSVTASMLRRPLLCGNTRSPMHNISSIMLCWFIVKLAWNSHKYCQWGKE